MKESPQVTANPAKEADDPPASVARATPPHVLESNEDQSHMVVRNLRSNRKVGQKALRAIEDALEATTSVWDAASKSFVERPDFKTRLLACTTYLAHTVGLPVQRNENLNISAPAKAAMPYDELLKRSPALREAARRALERADKAANAEQTPVDGLVR